MIWLQNYGRFNWNGPVFAGVFLFFYGIRSLEVGLDVISQSKLPVYPLLIAL